MTNEPSRDFLYRTAGEALHVGQVLEINIRSLISLLNRKHGSDLDANAIILAEDKKTLGRLIDALRPLGQFCPDTESALATALIARNYIAHDFFIRHNDAFSCDEAMQVALANLRDHHRDIVIAAAITSGFVKGFCEAFNVNLSDVLIRQDI